VSVRGYFLSFLSLFLCGRVERSEIRLWRMAIVFNQMRKFHEPYLLKSSVFLRIFVTFCKFLRISVIFCQFLPPISAQLALLIEKSRPQKKHLFQNSLQKSKKTVDRKPHFLL
jgi:hypothetical protein